MGGQALTRVITRRYSDQEFILAQDQIRRRFGNLLEDTDYHFVRSYHDKESHGDMDILVKKVDDPNYIDYIISLFVDVNSDDVEVYRNGAIISFNFNDLQVDLIFMKAKWWDSAKTFFAWNDLGNLMGKIARSRRIKWGFQGLRYTHYSEDRSTKIAEITLTHDPKVAFEYLGFDWDRSERGFRTLQDIFDYVINSKYFAKSVFDDSALTADQRHRDTKRKVYAEFKKFLNTFDGKETSPRPSVQEVLDDINLSFPDAKVKETITIAENRFRKAKEVALKFNGRFLMNNLDVKGPALGKLIGDIKGSFESEDQFQQWVLDSNPDNILTFAKIKLENGS